MLTLAELFLYGLAALVLLPLVIVAIATGAKPPQHSPLAKYYHAERRLSPLGNLLVLLIGTVSLVKLALHFGVIGPRIGDILEGGIGLAIFALSLAFLGLLIRAIAQVREAADSDPD